MADEVALSAAEEDLGKHIEQSADYESHKATAAPQRQQVSSAYSRQQEVKKLYNKAITWQMKSDSRLKEIQAQISDPNISAEEKEKLAKETKAIIYLNEEVNKITPFLAAYAANAKDANVIDENEQYWSTIKNIMNNLYDGTLSIFVRNSILDDAVKVGGGIAGMIKALLDGLQGKGVIDQKLIDEGRQLESLFDQHKVVEKMEGLESKFITETKFTDMVNGHSPSQNQAKSGWVQKLFGGGRNAATPVHSR